MERGSCRTCKHLKTYKKNDDDIFWTYLCTKKDKEMDNRSLNLLWICHESKDGYSLSVDGNRRTKSIWKDNDDEESVFDMVSTDDVLSMIEEAINDRVTYNLPMGRYVRVDADGNIIGICDEEYTKEYRGTSWYSYLEWKKEKEKKKGNDPPDVFIS